MDTAVKTLTSDTLQQKTRRYIVKSNLSGPALTYYNTLDDNTRKDVVATLLMLKNKFRRATKLDHR